MIYQIKWIYLISLTFMIVCCTNEINRKNTTTQYLTANKDIHAELMAVYEAKHDYKEYDNINKVIDTVIIIMKSNEKLPQEAPKLGNYEPFYPKSGEMERFPFSNHTIWTSVFIKPSTNMISNIYIGKHKEQIELLEIDFNRFDLEYIETKVTETPYIKNRYNVGFIYRLNDSNITIELFITWLLKEEAEELLKLKTPTQPINGIEFRYS